MLLEMKHSMYNIKHHVEFIGQELAYEILPTTDNNKVYIEITSEFPMLRVNFSTPFRVIARSEDIHIVELLPATNPKFLRNRVFYEINAPFTFKLDNTTFHKHGKNDIIVLNLIAYEEYVPNEPCMFTHATHREHLYKVFWNIEGWVTKYIDKPTEEDYNTYGQYIRGFTGEYPIIQCIPSTEST